MHIASEAGSFGEGSVHNGYVTETNAGEGARCALIRVSLCRANPSTVKTQKYKQDAKGADFAPRVYLDVLEPSKNASPTKHLI